MKTWLLVFAFALQPALGDETPVEIFNGRDLTGWVNVNCAPETWSVKDGVIHCTGFPTGALRTTRQFENFIFEVEWRHLRPGGNAGIFVWSSPLPAPGVPFLRAIEVQVLDNGYGAAGRNESFTTHGDIFPIHGSVMKPIHRGRGMRCFPSEERSRSSPEWNHYRIEARNGSLRLAVNGREVSGGDNCRWRKGYLALESEGSPIEWRHLRLTEFPTTHAAADDSAPVDDHWRPLYNGLDLRGWKPAAGSEDRWKASDWRLLAAGADTATALATESKFDEGELVIDWKASATGAPEISLGGSAPIPLKAVAPDAGGWHRAHFTVGESAIESSVTRRLEGEPTRFSEPARERHPRPTSDPAPITISARGPAEFASILVREK